MSNKKWGLLALAFGLAAAAAVAAGALRSGENPPEPETRSVKGRELELWMRFMNVYLGRDKLPFPVENGQPQILREIKEFDASRLTGGDRRILAELAERLHDRFRERNMHLEIAGLEHRRGGPVTTSSMTFDRPVVVIEVDPNRSYDPAWRARTQTTPRPGMEP